MNRSRAAIVGAVVAAQALFVGVAVANQLSAQTTGTEYLLRVGPVDPIDPFRGAYVALAYPDLPLPGDAWEPSSTQGERGTVFVPLVQDGNYWVGDGLLRERPAAGVYLICDTRSWRLLCGIESWFLPQEKAAAAAAQFARTAFARVKIDGRGNAALLRVEP